MAKLVEKWFTYKCEICGARFTHTIQYLAKDGAEVHEQKGKPAQYKYKIGDFITAKKITDFPDAKKIVRLVVDKDDHKPAYFLQLNQWEFMTIFVKEEDIEGLCSEHLLPIYRY